MTLLKGDNSKPQEETHPHTHTNTTTTPLLHFPQEERIKLNTHTPFPSPCCSSLTLWYKFWHLIMCRCCECGACQDALWLEVGGLAPGLPGGRRAREGGRRRRRGEGMWRRRRWFTLEGKVNSSCCFKSLGKPRPQRELDRAPLSECEPEQRYF